MIEKYVLQNNSKKCLEILESKDSFYDDAFVMLAIKKNNISMLVNIYDRPKIKISDKTFEKAIKHNSTDCLLYLIKQYWLYAPSNIKAICFKCAAKYNSFECAKVLADCLGPYYNPEQICQDYYDSYIIKKS
jgi:hypothetical protein